MWAKWYLIQPILSCHISLYKISLYKSLWLYHYSLCYTDNIFRSDRMFEVLLLEMAPFIFFFIKIDNFRFSFSTRKVTDMFNEGMMFSFKK